MRLPRVVAGAALIAVVASVVIPGAVGSWTPRPPTAIDPSAFQAVDLGRSWATMTTPQLDPADRSAGYLDPEALLGDPTPAAESDAAHRPVVNLPANTPIAQPRVVWHLDSNISWYGPGFYGHDGACGLIPGGMTTDTVGVANRTLPCGTKVTFRYEGYTVTTIVLDRGPYVTGRTWDMTHGLCALLHHCFTGGGVYWKIG